LPRFVYWYIGLLRLSPALQKSYERIIRFLDGVGLGARNNWIFRAVCYYEENIKLACIIANHISLSEVISCSGLGYANTEQ